MIQLKRETKETKISLSFSLYGKGELKGSIPIPFFRHMLSHLVYFSQVDLEIFIEGDLEVDSHHTVEDTALLLGEALFKALGDKRGIRRYGSILLPMDDVLVGCAIDLSGRPFFHFEGDTSFTKQAFPQYHGELTLEFFQKWAFSSRINLHLLYFYGRNVHHIHEALFKAVGNALFMAKEKISREGIPSTKGIL